MPKSSSRPLANTHLNILCSLVSVGTTFAAIIAPCFADKLALSLTSPSVLQERLEAGEVSASKRQSLVQRLFQQVGCQVTLQLIDKRSSNVICSLPGETSATIVVGAHFDFAEKGDGIVDDWSGVSLLISLYQTMKPDRPRHTYEFVAFAGEERGLLGSSRNVKELSAEQKARTQAFINLECLGLTPPNVWIHRSTPMLVERLKEVATAIHVPLQGVDVDRVGDDDTHPFLSKKIPVISIHSVTQETWGNSAQLSRQSRRHPSGRLLRCLSTGRVLPQVFGFKATRLVRTPVDSITTTSYRSIQSQ